MNEFCEEDENIVFSAIKDKVFSFLRTAVIAAPHFFEEVCIYVVTYVFKADLKLIIHDTGYSVRISNLYK